MSDDVEILTEDQLRFWYECLRKHSYASKSDADTVNQRFGNTEAYECEHCGNWHNGRPRAKKASVHQMRHDWNRRKDKPDILTITEAMKDPKHKTLKFWKIVESELKSSA